MNRRRFLQRAGATGAAALLAGCQAQQTTETPADTDTEAPTDTDTETTRGTATRTPEPGTLVVATYDSFIDAPSSSPGAWIKERFEAETGATLVWKTPPNEVNYFIERANAGVDTEADVYVGLDTGTLIRVDNKLKSGRLFDEAGDLEGRSAVKDGLAFDPKGRAVPYDTGYISLVWNATMGGGDFVAPETFDGLLDPEFEDDLLAQNPSTSETGRAFLLHTIKAKGEDGYLDYWSRLKDNGVRVLGKWDDAYNAYTGGEAPMVVSYSTDQVYAHRYGNDLAKHQIRFLNDQGYANPEGMARFANTDQPELARTFMEFLLRPEVQGEIAVRNVQFPATTDASLPESYAEYAKEPPEPVTFTYDELKGTVSDWIEQWQREFAG
ncbi:MAG: thiamine ABC transporter substrate binding subunit [Haloferacaceae archaeon]